MTPRLQQENGKKDILYMFSTEYAQKLLL